MALVGKEYLETLRSRAKKSHIYRPYQLLGLEIARILCDEKHKSLYMKLAKEGSGSELLGLAKDVADRVNVRKRGAYFMRIVKGLPKAPRRKMNILIKPRAAKKLPKHKKRVQ